MNGTPARVRLDSEAGFSLAEVLVTVVIVGITFAAVLGGLVTAITVSDYHRKQATADALARDSAEWVKNSVSTVYEPCASTGSYSLSGITLPSGYTATVSGVEYWDGIGPTGSAYNPTFVGTCPSPDKGLQRITITTSSSDGRATETVQITKRILA